MVFFVILLIIRWIDSFILRLDERIGELILTKGLGFILVLIFVWLAGRKVKDIGFHGTFLRQSLMIGTLTTTVAFIFGYGVEILLATVQGNQPSLFFGAIDSKMGVTGGFWFAIWLLFCNGVNSFMEEGFFRGVIGRLSRIRFNFWRTNWFQAAIFSIWHLPWVLKYYLIGDINTGGELASNIFFHSIPQLLIGLVYGYFYLKTGNLWAAWIAHAISNSVLNFLHVSTTDGIDTLLPIRMGTNLVIMLISMFWVRHIAEKHKMEEVKPWD
jgi:membrane protease YdiL (CAAX protease family)